ncbi:hypothetical protein [Methylorubrum populi]|uniref:hypothetical protein n=1 Tax=Methylorubrum populi TaxID=223967 RepID=UPI000DB5D3B1|nr:hypothetical protein [Methylorubrum populi]PZP71799.1 MAG: hypothetical protein DI590_05930 [Methylorubrum populi]
MKGGAPAHNIPLVSALTRLAWANQEAIEQAPNAKVAAILEQTGRAADEAARFVQFNQLDRLSEHQLKLVAQCEEDLAS